MTTVVLGLTAGVFFKWVGYILVALLCLMVMIVIHELGHYTAGKLFKFKINEFAIGFGPAIFKHTNKKNGEVFSIRCLPLGGYCAFAGEDENAVAPDDFNAKPVWQRIIVLFAGVFFNFMSAIVIISIFFMSYGEFFPTVTKAYDFVGENTQIEQVLKEGDIILKVDGKSTYSLLEPFAKLSKGLKNKESATLTISRAGQIEKVVVNKGNYIFEKQIDNEQVEKSEQHGIGVSLGLQRQKLGFFQSIGHS
ncbi:MAG: site-2 protease family protein, partial [Clostridia bacterium]